MSEEKNENIYEEILDRVEIISNNAWDLLYELKKNPVECNIPISDYVKMVELIADYADQLKGETELLLQESEEPTPEDCSPVERFSYEIAHEPISGMFYTTFLHPITGHCIMITGETEQDVIKKADWLSDITPPEGVSNF